MVFWKNIEPLLEVTLYFLNRADVFAEKPVLSN